MAENFDDMEKRLKAQAKLGEDLRKSSAKMAGSMKDYLELQFRLNKARKEEQKLQEKINKLMKESGGIITDEIRDHQELLKNIKKENDELAKGAKILKSQALSVKNMGIAIGRDVLKGLKSVNKEARKLSLEYFEQEKVIRRTSVNIGLAGKRQEQLRRTLYKSSLLTQKWGVSASELGSMYESYVDSVGRVTTLSKDAAEGLAKMAMGTALGSEGAAEMAANMDLFGLSIKETTKYVEDITEYTGKMGVNSGKVLKMLNANLKQANTIRFKDGISGMKKMASEAASLRTDMSGALNLAQDLWDPERAIEIGASLQMMGGAFARMGDPLTLMYDGRNNPEKLQQDLAKAAAESIKILPDGTFDKSSMELHRLRTISQELNMDFADLVTQGEMMARKNTIGRMLSPKITGDSAEFIKNVAEMDTNLGGWAVTIDDGSKKLVRNLTDDIVKTMVIQDTKLKKQAEDSQSAMDRFTNYFKSFKTLSFRFLTGLEKSLRKPIEALMGDGGLDGFGDKLEKWGVVVGNFIAKGIPLIGGAIDWLKTAIPSFVSSVGDVATSIRGFFKSDGWKDLKQAGVKYAGILTVVANLTKGLYKVIGDIFGKNNAPWIIGLGLVFRKQLGSLARQIFGRGSPGNPMYVVVEGGMGGGNGGVGGGLTGGKSTRGRRGLLKMFGKKGAGNVMGFGKTAMKGLRAGAPLAIAGMAMDIGRTMMDNPDSAFGQALGVGGSTASGAGYGAMIGSIIPGVGTMIGGILGGLVGAGKGMWDEMSQSILGAYDVPAKMAPKMNMGLGGASVATMMDGTVSPNGNVIATKSGELWNTSPGDYISVSRPQGSGNTGGGGGGNQNISLNITGTLRIDSNGSTADASSMIKDPIFVSELTRVITSTMKTQNR